MKKTLLIIFSALMVISCNKDDMGGNEGVKDPSNSGCSHNVIVYKTQYGYPLTLPDDLGIRAFGGILIDNYYEDDYGYLVFDSDVTQIPESAFAGITSLTHILLPAKCSNIGRYAFNGCKNMESISIPKSVTAMATNAFADCPGELIVDCNIPDEMGWFNESLFSKITIGDNVTAIGSHAFSNCHYIKSVDVGENVSHISHNAFSNSYLLEKFTGKYASTDNRCLIIHDVLTDFAPANITEYTIPKEATSIGTYAFSKAYGLNSIHIHNGITSIGNNAFNGCESLTGVYIKDIDIWSNISFDSEKSNPLFYGNSLYLNDELVTELSFSDTITTISDYAFYNCTSLSSITIHKNITDIGSYAFSGCSNLSKVDVSDLSAWCHINFEDTSSNPLSRAKYLYLNGHEIQELTIPSDVTEIKNYAFYNCSSLTRVTLHNAITSMGVSAFANCENLDMVLCLSATPPYIESNTFTTHSNTLLIYVPIGCVNSYKQSSGWYNYRSLITEIPYTPTVCTSLTITADNVSWNATTTTIYYTAITNGISSLITEPLTGVTITGTAQSDAFAQNTSTTQTKNRVIYFTYLGKTANTSITQGVKQTKSYTVNLNSQWRLSSSVSNPSSSTYDGVYESHSNYNINSSSAWMYINIEGYDTFTIYVRSNGENSYDYLTVYSLDSTTSTKMTTKNSQNSGTNISNYTAVTFSNIGGGSHRIAICYSKDSSQNSGTDRGYVLIPKNQ